MLRRWDLVALACLFAVPLVALGVYVNTAWNVDDVVADLDHALLLLPFTTPKGPPANAAPLAELADTPLTDDARKEIDTVLGGEKPPWELSSSTQDEVMHRENPRAALVSALERGERLRPLTTRERPSAVDLGRTQALMASQERSVGHGADADRFCAEGYRLAIAIAAGGALDDARVAADVFRVVNEACGENIGSGDRRSSDSRAPRVAAMNAVLDLAAKPARVREIVERDRVYTLLRIHHRVIGGLPAAVEAHVPKEWRFDDEPPLTSFRARLFGRLAMRAFATASAQAIGRDETSMPAVAPNVVAPFGDTKAPYGDEIAKARAGAELETSACRVILARLVAEVFVIDHKRWPTSAAEFHVDGDKALDDRVQAALHAQSIDLLEHDVYLTIIVDGSHSTRATLPDDLAALAKEPPPTPARDYTGRLIERPAAK